MPSMTLSADELSQAIACLKKNPPEVSQALAVLEGQAMSMGWIDKARDAVTGLLGRMNQTLVTMDGIDRRVRRLGEEIDQNPSPAQLLDIKTMLLHEVGHFTKAGDVLTLEIKKHEHGLKQACNTGLPVLETCASESAHVGVLVDASLIGPGSPEPAIIDPDQLRSDVSSSQADISAYSLSSAEALPGELSGLSPLCQKFAQCGFAHPKQFEAQVSSGMTTGQPSALIVIQMANIQKLVARTSSNTVERLADHIKGRLKLEAKNKDVFGLLDDEHIGLFLCNILPPVATALARRIAAQLAVKVKGQDGQAHTLEIRTSVQILKKDDDSQSLLSRGLASVQTGQNKKTGVLTGRANR